MENFYRHIFQQQQEVQDMPSNTRIAEWATHVLHLLFPERASSNFREIKDVKQAFGESEEELFELLDKTKACSDCDNKRIASHFFKMLPTIYEVMLTDAQAIMEGD